MSDGLDDGIDGYLDEGISTFATMPGYSDISTPPSAASAPPAPQPQPQAAPRPPVQNFAPPAPRTGPMVTVLFRGLGDFDVAGRCAIVALSRVAWLFWSKVADGQTTAALGILELYRSLWNLKRDSIASGFVGHGVEHLPGILPAAEWSQPMRYSMAYAMAGATGFYTDVANVLARMPDSMAALPQWFQQITAALPASDLPALRAYVDSPLPMSGDPAIYYANYVRDDLSRCGAPATAPAPAPTQYQTQAPQGQSIAPFRPAPSPTPGGSATPGTGGPGASSSGGGLFSLLAMLALIGYGGYLAIQDSKPKEKDA